MAVKKKPAPRRKAPKQVGTLTHAEAKRRNIPTSDRDLPLFIKR